MSGGISAASIGTASLGLQSVGAVASAYSAFTKSKASAAADNYQAAVMRNNAQMAEWNAEDATKRGQSVKAMHDLKVAKLKGTQRASLAARGIDLGEGSPLDLLTDTDVMGKIDSNTIIDNHAKEAWMYRTQAANAGSNADLLSTRASNTNPWGEAAGTLLTGAGSVARGWYDLKTRGTY